MSNGVPAQLLCALLLVSALACLVALRVLRQRQWTRILGRPATELPAARRRKLLPKGIALDSDAPLFEVLYESFRTRPRLFGPQPVTETLFKLGSVEAPPLIEDARRRPSDDERINHLVSLRYYHQNPEYVPVDAFAGSVLKNVLSVYRREKPLSLGVEHAVLDSISPGAGLAGAKLGTALGLAVTPALTSLSFGVLPLFMLAGAWFGSTLGRELGERVKARRLYAALRGLKTASREFKRCFLVRFPALLGELDREFEARIELARKLARDRASGLKRAIWPDLMTVFFGMSRDRLKADWKLSRATWKQVRRNVRAANPLGLANVLHGLGCEAFESDPELLAHFREYDAAFMRLKRVKAEAAKATRAA